MKRNLMILAVLAAATLVASACAPQAAPAPVPTTQPAAVNSSPTQAPSAAMPSGPAMVNLASGALAAHLVDDKGMTLYLFTKDSPSTTTCYDKCASAWPPLLTSGTPQAGSGVDASKFGTTTRTDGTTQVTYNGWPLYYFAKDKQAGDTTGEGVGSVWYCISASGDAIKQ
jgi:predicted lipoprotein with Yx(FWY)xxD motif